MAFKDMEVVLYGGKYRITYLDKAHRYYRSSRINWDLPETDPKAWGKKKQPKGTTTLLGDTLEKKGLMTWPMGLALRELFGFYDFTNENGERMTGFSKDVGTFWTRPDEFKAQDTALPNILSASKAWQRKQKKGADIGNVVHDAIEHFVREQEFDIGLTYLNSVKEAEYESEAMREKALKEFDEDVKQATAAFNEFVRWWNEKKPTLVGAEELVYSPGIVHTEANDPACLVKDENGECHCEEYSGTYDGLIRLDAKLALCDWKTSNASASREAAAPQGVYYSYFIQSAAYAAAWAEMGNDMPDDLLIVSARKDGGFDTKLLSEVGLSVQQAVDWWKAVKTAYRNMAIVKAKLIEQGGL